MKRYCLVVPKDSKNCWEVVPANIDITDAFENQFIENKPSEFTYDGHTYNTVTYAIRKMSPREISNYYHKPLDKVTIDNRDSIYREWLEKNDTCENLGLVSFYVGEKKFFTIDREEFKTLVSVEKEKGSFNFNYRGNVFSVYHYC